MPLYDFNCGDCGHRFEKLAKPEATPECPKCHSGSTSRDVSAPAAVHFRGTGFYATDYKGK